MALADEPDDIGADILAAMNGEPETPETGLSAPETIIPADSGEETEEQKAERLRDEHGRFAKAPETEQDTPAQAQEPAKPTILPPRSWTATAKAKFATLDPDVQQEVLRRESEIDAGKQKWDSQAEQFNQYEAVLAPLKAELAMRGFTPVGFLQAMTSADAIMRKDPVQGLVQIAGMYGLNPNDVAQYLGQQSGGSPQGQPYQDPQYQTLLTEFQKLQARVDQRDQAAEQEAVASQQARIEAFRNDPKHLYFDNVKTEMAALLQAGSAKDLDDAYDMAVNARPDIRALLQAAAAAKPATLTRPGGPQVTGAQRGATPPAQAANQNANIEDDVRDAINQLAGRV